MFDDEKSRIIFVLNILLILLIFILDIFISLRIPVWLLYFIPINIVAWNLKSTQTYFLAFISSVCIFLDLFLSPKGDVPYNLVLVNRILGTIVMWVLIYFISQRKNTLQSLQHTSGLLESIFNNTHLLYAYMDRNYKIVKVNKAFTEATKKEELFFIGKSYFEIFPSNDYKKIFNDVMKNGNPYFESSFTFPSAIETSISDKSILLNPSNSKWDFGLVPVKNSKEKVTGLILSLNDLTQRINIEQALRENQARLNGIISSAMDAIISIDSTQKVILFNLAAEKMFKIKAEEALGQHINKFIPDQFKKIHEDHVKSFGKTKVSMRSMGKLGSVVGLRTDGFEFPIEASISQIDTGSEKVYTVILRDITQRRQIEEQVKNQKIRAEILSDISKEFSEASLDLNTTLSIVSKRLCELIGGSCIIRLLNDDETLLEPTSFYHISSEYSDTVKKILATPTISAESPMYSEVLETGKSLFYPEVPDEVLDKYKNNLKNIDNLGSLKLRSLIIVPLKAQRYSIGTLEIIRHEKKENPLSNDDKLLIQDIADRAALAIINAKNYTGKLHEIEERKRAEENLIKIKEELERSNSELEQFAYVASHDLQEPLRMIASYVQLLARRYKDKLDENANDFINFAVDGANRMQKLIHDLLAYSRVSSRGKQYEPTNLNKALDSALLNLKLIIEETGAVITKDDLPDVIADPVQMEQLFQNLVGNAIKFRGERKPDIKIGKEISNGKWLFFIKDNGIGIDKKYKDLIFVIFQRLNQNNYPGTGIGLAVCKKIVERHGGKIWLESETGQGSTFYFTLPKKELNNL